MKVAVYDKNPGEGWSNKGLALSWLVGCFLAKLFGAIDEYHGATSWEDAIAWLKSKGELDEIQYWGHGSPGQIWLSGKALAVNDLAGIKMSEDGLVWWRVCSSFQALRGMTFASRVSKLLNCDVAGHTRIIGLVQGGLHVWKKDQMLPSWLLEEGEPASTWFPSWLKWDKRSILCFRMSVPKGW